MASRTLGLNEFVGHDTRGPSGSFLRGWKKRTPPAVNTWLHTRAPIIALWQHQFPRIHTFEDRDTGTTKREVWGGTFNCLETEDTLKNQYKRADDGARDYPPAICPMCLMLEWVRNEVMTGKMEITCPLFKFVGDSEERIITAGGLTGLYNLDPMPDAFMKQIRAAKVRLSEAWKEASNCKCNYVFRVVDDDHPDAGIQIAIETTLLGDKVKGVIRDCITKLGDVDGHPLKKPYCIRWEHRPAEREFQKKYHALDMPKVVLSEPVRQLIFDEPPPNVDGIVAPGNVATLRATLERHALAKLPWDEFFATAEEQAGASGDLSEPLTDDEKAAEAAPAPAPAPAAAPAATSGRQRKAKPPPDVKMIPCDSCGKEMPETGPGSDKCQHCGEEYEFQETPAAAPAAAPASTAADDEDDIPF